MNVVWTRLFFYDFHALLFAQLSKYCKKYSILNMVVPHHGGNVGKIPSPLYICKPGIAIISTNGVSYGHPYQMY